MVDQVLWVLGVDGFLGQLDHLGLVGLWRHGIPREEVADELVP